MEELPGRIRIKDIAKEAGVSVGTVDRVLHSRPNVSQKSRIKVEEVLKRIDYQPNMYASALASNKRYKFIALLPKHKPGEYWTEVETGMSAAQTKFSDFYITVKTLYYDPFESDSFKSASAMLINENPDGAIINPTKYEATSLLTEELHEKEIPFVFIDSNIPELHPLAFYAQHPKQSGYFAARMLELLVADGEIGVFEQSVDGNSGSNQQKEREEGFMQYMKEQHPTVKINRLQLPAKNFGRQFDIMDEFFASNPNMKGGVCFNSKVFGIGEFLQKRHITGFHLIGYDYLERNNECLRNGYVDFIIAQHPWKQGYGCVQILVDYLILKKKVNRQNYVPIEMLSKENIDFYSKTY